MNILTLLLQVNFQYYRGPGLEFTFSLHTEDGEETVSGLALSRFGVQETTNDGKANFRIRPPAVGVYKLAVYAREVQMGESTNRMYCAVVEYRVGDLIPAQLLIPHFLLCASDHYNMSHVCILARISSQ